jgi:hypothetical protein
VIHGNFVNQWSEKVAQPRDHGLFCTGWGVQRGQFRQINAQSVE